MIVSHRIHASCDSAESVQIELALESGKLITTPGEVFGQNLFSEFVWLVNDEASPMGLPPKDMT